MFIEDTPYIYIVYSGKVHVQKYPSNLQEQPEFMSLKIFESLIYFLAAS